MGERRLRSSLLRYSDDGILSGKPDINNHTDRGLNVRSSDCLKRERIICRKHRGIELTKPGLLEWSVILDYM